jgi:hypothetical protein
MERALGVWLADGDGGWHITQGGVYGVTEEGKARDEYLYLHSVYSPFSYMHSTSFGYPDHFQLGKLMSLSQTPTHVVVFIT